jgi:hypothetical protein
VDSDPYEAVSDSDGKYCVRAASMRRLAAASWASTCLTSGRRSSMSEGNPAGTSGTSRRWTCVTSRLILASNTSRGERPRIARQRRFVGSDRAFGNREVGRDGGAFRLRPLQVVVADDAGLVEVVLQGQRLFARLQGIAQQGKFGVSGEQAEIGACALGGDGGANRRARVFGGQQFAARRIRAVAITPPEVEFIRCAQADAGSRCWSD